MPNSESILKSDMIWLLWKLNLLGPGFEYE